MRRAKTLRAHRKTNEERNSIGHDGGFGLVGCVTDDGDVTFAIRSADFWGEFSEKQLIRVLFFMDSLNFGI